jgi:hypothetical protein
MRTGRESRMGLASARAIQKLAGTAPRKEAALRADIFMSWLKSLCENRKGGAAAPEAARILYGLGRG